MLSRLLVTFALVCLVGSAVTGCSASGSVGTQASTHATSSGDVLAVWQRFAVCARAHGVPNLPDPQLNAQGKATFPGFDGSTAPDTVRTACASILDALPVDTRPNAAPTDIAGLLRFAQCLRGHGFPDWPDPKADGTFPAAQLPSFKTPALISAMRACDSLNPDKGGHIYGS